MIILRAIVAICASYYYYDIPEPTHVEVLLYYLILLVTLFND